MNTGKVVVSYCRPSDVSGLFNDSLAQLLLHDARKAKRIVNGGGVVSIDSGPRIASARNKLAKTFLEYPGKPEWLWMVDADMTFPADVIDRLVPQATTNQCQVLGGLCFGGGRGGLVFPTLYRMHAPDENNQVVEIVEDYPKDALVKIDATGCACLLIHRSVLEKMYQRFGDQPAPWFAETFYAGREFGEDWTFCMRAQQMGVDVWVDTGVKIGHVKPGVFLDEQAFGEFKRLRKALGGEQAVAEHHRQRMFGGSSGVGLVGGNGGGAR